eukprot:c8217_g2_i1 orf=2-160(-)
MIDEFAFHWDNGSFAFLHLSYERPPHPTPFVLRTPHGLSLKCYGHVACRTGIF